MTARRVLLAAALVCGAAAGPACHRSAPAVPSDAPPVYATLSDLRLLDQDGQPFSAGRLRGKVWITAFMFTSCPMECPLLTQRMGYVQKLLAQRSPTIQLLSISVNPGQDTPEVLREYGTRYHRDPARWTFLTGESDPVLRAVSKGYERVTKASQPAKPGGFEALHGDNLVLIDGQGRVRGYYQKDDAEVARLLADAERLAGKTS